jgi:hypothetical protein
VAGTRAHNVLDSVKAADALWSAHAGRRAVVLGWSEGGGASLWSGQDVADGKPVRVLDTAALAPNADIYNEVLGAVRPGPTDASAPSHEAALQMALYIGVKADPNLRLSDVLTINPNSTTQYIKRACRLRQQVQYTTCPGQTHQTIPTAAQNQYVHWIAARFARQRAPDNCA